MISVCWGLGALAGLWAGSSVVSFLPGLWASVFVGDFVLFGLSPFPIFLGEVLSVFSLPGRGFGPQFFVFFGWALPLW